METALVGITVLLIWFLMVNFFKITEKIKKHRDVVEKHAFIAVASVIQLVSMVYLFNVLVKGVAK